MNQLSVSLYLAAFVPLAALTVAIIIDKKRRKAVEKPPQTEKLLRPPGYSLSLKLDDVSQSMLDKILWASPLGAIAGVFAALAATFAGRESISLWLAAFVVLFLVFASASAWLCLCAFKQYLLMRNIRLGLRGEQAVAETLHEVGDCGFRIFHDLPGGENWNIDHIAVGTRGVFLIETKARRRRKSRNGQPEHIVIYDGAALCFPSGSDTNAISQAERNARWLSEFLAKRTAKPVVVEPLIVVPGWYVETKGNFPVKVMNATYLASFLRGQGEKIDSAQVRRIVAAIDDKCRDLEF